MLCRMARGRAVARNFYWGGGIFIGDYWGFIGAQTHLPKKFSFSSDFGHLILKMLENAKNTFQEKRY